MSLHEWSCHRADCPIPHHGMVVGSGGRDAGCGWFDVSADIKPCQLETGPVTKHVCVYICIRGCVRERLQSVALSVSQSEELIESSLKGQSQESDQRTEKYLFSDCDVAIKTCVEYTHTHDLWVCTQPRTHFKDQYSGIRHNAVIQCNSNECSN